MVMSVLCGRIPHIPLSLAARHQPDLLHKSTVLIGRDAVVCDLSPSAYQSGVRVGMNPRQSKIRCPDVAFVEANLLECEAVQRAFEEEWEQWELPVELHGLGMAYADLHQVTTQRKEAEALAADLGSRVRKRLGDDLQPSLGWDHSKFTSRAAAYHTTPGRMRLVAKEDEVSFLAPLPISYLPLPAYHLQRLRWMNITTLGQFAALPAGAVLQQFGKQGQLAQRWAQGHDNRAVRNMLHGGWQPLEIAFETPIEQSAPVIEHLMATLKPYFEAWAEELRGCTRLRFELYFANRERRVLDLNWIDPVAQLARARLHITNQLEAFNWLGALDRLVIIHAVTAELPALQLSLFEEPLVETATLEEEIAPLKHTYGAFFWRPTLLDETHPLFKRRVGKVAL